MSAFFLAASLFIFAFAVHVAIWRLRPPRATGHALILVLVFCILGGAAALALGDEFFPSWRAWLPPTLSDWLQAVVAALAVACLYVMNYPAVEVDSPSLAMADLFARAGANGLSREELYRTLDDDFLVVPRLNDLVREGLVVEARGKYRLTGRGLRLTHVFSLWRRILGAEIGG